MSSCLRARRGEAVLALERQPKDGMSGRCERMHALSSYATVLSCGDGATKGARDAQKQFDLEHSATRGEVYKVVPRFKLPTEQCRVIWTRWVTANEGSKEKLVAKTRDLVFVKAGDCTNNPPSTV